MNSTIVNFRIDMENKKAFEEFCKKVGFSPSTALNMFIIKTIQMQKIPFEISSSEISEYDKHNKEENDKFREQLNNQISEFNRLKNELESARKKLEEEMAKHKPKSK